MKRIQWLLPVVVLALAAGSSRTLHAQSCVAASQVTLSGSLRAANGLPQSNLTMSLTPSQTGFVAGCGVNLPVANYCATSTDGSVVGLSNPNTASVVTTTGSGTLPATTYYVEYTFVDAAGHQSLPSPETVRPLSITGGIVVNPPASGLPASAVGMNVYIATTSGAETLQGSTTGSSAYTQSVALTTGTALPSTNNTLCQVTANDSIWPVGTGYNVSLVDRYGNAIPGYPMQWQLMGAGNTINLSNGLPYYNGVVQYPVPVLTSPLNHGTQSISGSLNLSGYKLLNVHQIGCDTTTPGWSIDCPTINASTGFLVGGNGGTEGQCLTSDGTYFDTPATCLTSLPTIYYQTVALNGTAKTQRPTLNFSTRFAATDVSSPAETTIDVNGTGSEAKVVTAATAGTSGNCAQWDSSGGVSDAGAPCGTTAVQTATSNVFNVGYHNATTYRVMVQASSTITGGSGDSHIRCYDGPSSASIYVWGYTEPSTASGAPVGISCMIPPGYWYEITIDGNISGTPTSYFVTTF